MKTVSLFFFAAILFTVSGGEKTPSSLDLFPDDLAMAVSFDDGQGRISVMDGEIYAEKMKNAEFSDKGISGKAMTGGSATYNVRFGHFGFGTDATVVFWFAFARDDTEVDKRLLIPLSIDGDQAKLIVGRQGWGTGKCNIYNYVYLPEKKKAMSRIFGAGSIKKWKAGEWHMIATTWTPNSLGISVDASLFDQIALNAPFPRGIKQITFHAEKGLYMLDELMFFDRKLSREELQKLYDAFISIKK